MHLHFVVLLCNDNKALSIYVWATFQVLYLIIWIWAACVWHPRLSNFLCIVIASLIWFVLPSFSLFSITLLYCNHITLSASVLLRSEVTQSKPCPHWLERESRPQLQPHTQLCLHHAGLHSSLLLNLLPVHPQLLLPEWVRPHCSDTYWSSSRHPPGSSRPKLCHRFPGHSLCWATDGEAAFPSCWPKASVDRGVWSQRLP